MNKNTIALLIATSLTAGSAYAVDNLKDLDPSRSHLKETKQEGDERFYSNVYNKVTKTYTIGKQLYNGQYEEITGELVEAFLAKLAGKSRENFVKEGNNEFDQKVLSELSKNLTNLIFDKIWKSMNVRTDIFTLDINGNRQPIYNDKGSLFRYLAEKMGIQNLPCGGLILTLLDLGFVKDYMTKRTNEFITKSFLSHFQSSTNMTAKQATSAFIASLIQKKPQEKQQKPTVEEIKTELLENGQTPTQKEKVVTLGSKENKVEINSVEIILNDNYFVTENIEPELEIKELNGAENSSFSSLWDELFKPYLSYYMRQTVCEMLQTAKGEVLKEIDPTVRYGFVETGGFFGSTLGGPIGGLGSTLLTSFISTNPYLLVPVGFVFSYAGLKLGGAGGSIYGNSQAESSLATFDKELTKAIEYLSFKLCSYEQNEHVLFHLNENPSEIEKSLYHDDYKLLDELKKHSVIEMIIKDLCLTDNRFVNLFKNAPHKVYESALSLFTYFRGNKEDSMRQALQFLKIDEDKFSINDLIIKKKEESYRKYIRFFNSSSPSKDEKKILKDIECYVPYEKKIEYYDSLGQYLGSYFDKGQLESYKVSYNQKKQEIEKQQKEASDKIKIIDNAIFDLTILIDSSSLGLNSTVQKTVINFGPNQTFLPHFTIIEKTLASQLDALTVDQQDLISKIMADKDYVKTYFDQTKTIDASKLLIDMVEGYEKKLLSIYQKDHKAEIEFLESRSITHQLSDYGIIKLHQKLTECKSPYLLKIKNVFETPEVPDELIDFEDTSYYLKHAEEIRILWEKYFELVNIQRAMGLCNQIEVSVNGRIEQLSKKIAEKIYEDQNFKKLILEKDIFADKKFLNEISPYSLKVLETDKPSMPVFEALLKLLTVEREIILPIFQPRVCSLFEEKIIEELETIKTTSHGQFDIIEKDLKENSHGLSRFIPSFWSSSESKKEILLKADTTNNNPLNFDILYLYDKEDIAGFYVKEHINSIFKEKKDKDKISLKDLILIHKSIHTDKLNKIQAGDHPYIEKYWGEIKEIKSCTSYKGKLFYAYSDLVEELNKQNTKVLREIKYERK